MCAININMYSNPVNGTIGSTECMYKKKFSKCRDGNVQLCSTCRMGSRRKFIIFRLAVNVPYASVFKHGCFHKN